MAESITVWTKSGGICIDEVKCREYSLLEKLRWNSPFGGPDVLAHTDVAARRKIQLLIENRAEFPSKIRPWIDDAAANKMGIEARPLWVLTLVEAAVRSFFWGGTKKEDIHGLDRNVDTPDQVELALRFFPRTLIEQPNTCSLLTYVGVHMPHPTPNVHPMIAVIKHSKGLPFLPLMAKVCINVWKRYSFCIYDEDSDYNLDFPPVLDKILRRLLMNWGPDEEESSEGTSDGDDDDDEEEDEEKAVFDWLDEEESFEILKRVKETGFAEFVDEEPIFESNALVDFLSHAAASRRDVSFIEKRIRFLVDWEPGVLMYSSQRQGDGLLEYFLNCSSCSALSIEVRLRLIEVIVELGFSHVPKEMGCVFMYDVFPTLCERYGREVISKIVNKRLMVTLGKPATSMKEMVIQSASEEGTCEEEYIVSLDGLYTLLRSDPNAWISEIRQPSTESPNPTKRSFSSVSQRYKHFSTVFDDGNEIFSAHSKKPKRDTE